MKGLAANRKKPVLKPIDRVFIRKTEKRREHMTESQLVGACDYKRPAVHAVLSFPLLQSGERSSDSSLKLYIAIQYTLYINIHFYILYTLYMIMIITYNVYNI